MPRKTVLRIGLGIPVFGAMLILVWQLWVVPLPPAQNPTTSPVTLEGNWYCIGVEADGKKEPRWMVDAQGLKLTISGDKFALPRMFADGTTFSFPGSPANAIDINTKSAEEHTELIRGIAALDRDTLRLAFAFDSRKPRPIGFETGAGNGYQVFAFRRHKPDEVLPETAGTKLGMVLEEADQRKPLTADKAEQLAARCLKIAQSNPGTDEAVVALLWVLANASKSRYGDAAWSLLRNGEIAGANLETLAMCFGIQCGTIGPGHIPDRFNQELAVLLLERVRRTPDHPKAAEVLCEVCYAPYASPEVPPVFDEAVRMIAERWTNSPDISHFLETLSYHCQRTWAVRYEPVVRLIATRNTNPYIRYRAEFTLAQLIAETGESRQEEARELYARFVKEADPVRVDPGLTDIVKEMVEKAKRETEALLIRRIGGPAPSLEGFDLDGKPMALIDYRSKVVLLSFWASWCNPCMKLVPHERKLLEQLKGRPFEILGVNGDEPGKLDRKILEKYAITWRSFQDERPNQKTISREWNLAAWPTLYLIDHDGKIRRRWTGTPPMDEFDYEIERWVAVAEGKPLGPAFRPGKVAEVPAAKGLPAKFPDKGNKD